MSRLIRKPIEIPKGVEVKIDPNTITVKGPLGQLSMNYLFVDFKIDGNKIWVSQKENLDLPPRVMKKNRAIIGTRWALLKNMIEGVTKGFQKELEVEGVGYRAQLQGKSLILNLGYIQPVKLDPPKGITIEVPKPNQVIVKGIDKELVGQFAAKIRKTREPMVFAKGKGVRYAGEAIRLKEVKKV
ncbi:50S ribosomal protein L6 [Athalassotoga saccharophila]|uniref:50S ribosomal protein L6 n=1 Tax=Athalassotoga saccharophila TaxID=1441386 RepID=UPI00137B02B0|nr:50S ribosomal protein L6 [Athalassotoga saccharophila]BBJ27217.1 50S ribosomal protein L6 [Athalassotoga saccharophila]